MQKDFNVEAYDLLLSENYLKGLQERLDEQFAAIDAKNKLLPGIEQEHYCELYKAKSSLKYVAERIEKAKGIFRSKAFYDVNVLSTARSTLKLAQAIISTGCHPGGQDLMWPVNARLQRSLEDIHTLTQNKHENPFLELYEQHLLPFIRQEEPDLIGLSITVDSQLLPALSLSRLIKTAYPQAHVVVGGGVVTLLADVLAEQRVLFDLYFDSALPYEGERPMLKLTKNLSQHKPLDDVPNLIYPQNGTIRVNQVQPAEDINELPAPSFDGLPLDLYLNPEPVLPLLSSRGCYWGKCAFCSDNLLFQDRYQCRDASKVVDDMQELNEKYGARHFAFSDECISPSSIDRIADELIKRNTDFRCSADVRLERQFVPELCHKMRRAGFILLYSGLESACNRVLDHMCKGTNKETATQVCRNIYQAGIWNHLYVFFGFPTESWSEARETIDFLIANKDYIHSFNIDKFILPKKAPMTQRPQQYGISHIDAGKDILNLSYSYTVSSGLTSDQAEELSLTSHDDIARVYKSKKFFKLNLESLLTYLSHFEHSDPYLQAAVSEKAKTMPLPKPITRKSTPRIKNNVILDKLHFNIVDIMNNAAGNNTGMIHPSVTHVITDPVSGNLQSIAPSIVDVLSLCDGRNSVQQIARTLAKKYNIDGNQMEDNCMSLLKSLAREGYVVY